MIMMIQVHIPTVEQSISIFCKFNNCVKEDLFLMNAKTVQSVYYKARGK